MKSGSLPRSERQAADDLIAGSHRDPTRLGRLADDDPDTGEGTNRTAGIDEGDAEPAMAPA
jgi:hypothetical protein